jgi:translation initiation factor IF-1
MERQGVSGTIVALLPRRLFRVVLDTHHVVVAHATDSSRRNFIRLLEGDRVRVEIAPHDATKGRIVERL